jgi:hypothetical protein
MKTSATFLVIRVDNAPNARVVCYVVLPGPSSAEEAIEKLLLDKGKLADFSFSRAGLNRADQVEFSAVLIQRGWRLIESATYRSGPVRLFQYLPQVLAL